MDSNTHSTQPSEPSAPEGSTGLGFLTAANDALAAEDLDRLSDTALTEETLALQQLLDCLGGQWLRRLAAVDARGAAGADRGEPVPSTAGWLGDRLRMRRAVAREAVRTARALFHGPLPRPPRP